MTVSTHGRVSRTAGTARNYGATEAKNPHGAEARRNLAPSTNPQDRRNSLWTPEAKTNLNNRHAMIEWASTLDKQIRGKWTFFHTHTFGTYTHPVTKVTTGRPAIPRHNAMNAGALLTQWCSRWEQPNGDKYFRFLLWSAESHLTGNVHLHALSVVTPETLHRHCDFCKGALSRSTEWRILKESWWAHCGRAVIRPFDESLRMGAERYVTKYVMDEKCLDWGIEEW
jgi:hypothetical protein